MSGIGRGGEERRGGHSSHHGSHHGSSLQSLTNILLVHLPKAPRLRIQEAGQRQDLALHLTTEEDDIMVVEQLHLTSPVPGHL